MQKNFGFHLFNLALVGAILLLGYLCISEPYTLQLAILFYLSIAFLVIRLWVAALSRISRSRLSDGMKLCWTLLAILAPVVGSIAALFVVRE